jgi:hypothetical protein
MTSDMWHFLPEQPFALSIAIWVLVFIIVMYVARKPAHQVIAALTRSLRNALRIMARSVMLAEEKLKRRNSEVLLAQGRENIERDIEREFQRVEALITRDLSGYPSLQRDLKEQIAKIDEDYVQSGEVPPHPPEWLKVIDAVADIPSNGSPVVAKILSDVHTTLKKSMNRDITEYRRANKKRHDLLKRMLPYWRSLTRILTCVETKITGLEHRSNVIDEQMTEYEQIRAKTDYAERMLSSSSLTQFFVSGLVLFIAVVGGYVNFQLVALPISEMVGASNYLGPIKASDVAALFIIAAEVILGLFLMESIGVTRLFPIISMLDDIKRKVIFLASFVFLLIFACIEASLAYMRDMLASDNEALTQMLSGIEVVEPEFRWITSIGQMAMGFILPFVLTFVAIPLESFVHSTRTVIGLALVWLMHMLSFVIRLLANIINNVGQLTITIYDLTIFLPLRIEELFASSESKEKNKGYEITEVTEFDELKAVSNDSAVK